MAISEVTKVSVKKYRDMLDGRVAAIDRDIAEHQAAINMLEAQKAALKTENDAIKADIAEPTAVEVKPVEEPVVVVEEPIK
jgi:hypothetical protein